MAFWAWLTGTWTAFAEWARTPGFGGTMAVGAAIIAYLGVRKTVEHQRWATRKQQWWERARWALDAMTSDDAGRREAGYAMAEALSDDEYSDVHEASLLDAVTSARLEEVAPKATRDSVSSSDDRSEPDEREGDDDQHGEPARERPRGE